MYTLLKHFKASYLIRNTLEIEYLAKFLQYMLSVHNLCTALNYNNLCHSFKLQKKSVNLETVDTSVTPNLFILVLGVDHLDMILFVGIQNPYTKAIY